MKRILLLAAGCAFLAAAPASAQLLGGGGLGGALGGMFGHKQEENPGQGGQGQQ